MNKNRDWSGEIFWIKICIYINDPFAVFFKGTLSEEKCAALRNRWLQYAFVVYYVINVALTLVIEHFTFFLPIQYKQIYLYNYYSDCCPHPY